MSIHTNRLLEMYQRKRINCFNSFIVPMRNTSASLSDKPLTLKKQLGILGNARDERRELAHTSVLESGGD